MKSSRVCGAIVALVLTAGMASAQTLGDLAKQEAERRSTSMSELTRTALRGYLQPRVVLSLSWAASIEGFRVFSYTMPWVSTAGWYGQTEPLKAPSDQVPLALSH